VKSNPRILLLLVSITCASYASAQDTDPGLNPTRPTISNSAAIQNPHVLQVELGYDAYPQHVPGNQQTLDTLFTYTALPRLRLDFDIAPFAHQQQDTTITNGVSTLTVGGKVELRKEDYHRPAPGIALQYEAELPTASNAALNNLGQQFILLVNHHYGPTGDLDVIANASIVQANCPHGSGPQQAPCSYGGQQSIAVSFHVTKSTRLYGEAFAQNVSQSNTPPGTYLFGGFYHPFSDSFGLDGGVRFGVSPNSASIGTTIGLVFGKKL
jgi:hypothetical protein